MNNNNYNNNYDGTFNGAPTWWCNTDATTTGDTLTFTASTDDSGSIYSGNILSLTTNTTWDFHNNYDLWPRGVQDPSTELKYTPKWHILLGYKAQIQLMWDDRSTSK